MLALLIVMGWLCVQVTVAMSLLGLLMKLANGRPSKSSHAKKLQVIFLHPDLGIGGAERLIVDAAIGLQEQQNCEVTIYTNHHDPKRCFPETTSQLRVRVVGAWIPRALQGKFLVMLATIKMMMLALYLCIPFVGPRCDCYVVDQVAGAMPWLKLLTRRGVFFYCHHPDQLCDPNRIGETAPRPRGLIRQVYRYFFDLIEGVFMIFSDRTVCNSKYTLQITQQTFPGLPLRSVDVLYPPINIPAITKPPKGLLEAGSIAKKGDAEENYSRDVQEALELQAQIRKEGQIVLLSLNRYERKKNVGLAIEAFDEVIARAQVPSAIMDKCHLYIAGGYDFRLAENVEHHLELQKLAFTTCKHIKPTQVTFLRSVSMEMKYVLLAESRTVLYTPTNEHFGIVPVEAMSHGKVVIAVNQGGPTESIGLAMGDQFGLLRNPERKPFGQALELAILDAEGTYCQKIGQNAINRVNQLFSLEAFSTRLAEYLRSL